MSILDPDSGLAKKYTRRAMAEKIFVQYAADKAHAPTSGSHEEYRQAAKASFELADIFLSVQDEQPPVVSKRPTQEADNG